MAHVVVDIAGRTYRMACDDGEEPRLEALARMVEEKINAMREGFGEIGEQRAVVMAAIAIADEAHDARARFAKMEAELGELRASAEAQRRRLEAFEDRAAKAIEEATRRVERAAKEIAEAQRADEELP